MKEQLRRWEQRTPRVLSDQNDQQQHNRRWNLRVYNMEEKAGETAEDCAKKCCQMFTDLIGVLTKQDDLEALGLEQSQWAKWRPITVCFQSRKLKTKCLPTEGI